MQLLALCLLPCLIMMGSCERLVIPRARLLGRKEIYSLIESSIYFIIAFL